MYQKGFIVWIIFIGVVVATSVVIYISAPNTLPGDLLYPIKEISENLRLAANELSFENRTTIFTQLSDRRLDEFKKLVSKREYTKIAETLDRMILMQKKAIVNIEQQYTRGKNITALLSALEESLQKQQSTLKDLYVEILPQNYDNLNKAIESTEGNLNQVNMLKARR